MVFLDHSPSSSPIDPLPPLPPLQVLCRLHSFNEGLVFLLDKLRLHREVLQVRVYVYV